MEVIVKIRKSNPWTGITKWQSCYDYVGTYFTRSGNMYTGLSKEDEKRLEKSIGYADGTLAPYSEFWNTFSVKIGTTGLILHTENPGDELQYLFLKSHKRVAKDMNSVTPSTDYVMVNRDTEAEQTNKYNRVKLEAFKNLDGMTIDEKRKCLRLYGIMPTSMNNDMVETKLFELVDSNPSLYLNRWVNNSSREMQYIVEEAVAKNILRKNKNQYYFGTDIIGHGMDDAVAFLKHKKNQDVYRAIMNEISSK